MAGKSAAWRGEAGERHRVRAAGNEGVLWIGEGLGGPRRAGQAAAQGEQAARVGGRNGEVGSGSKESSQSRTDQHNVGT